MMPDEKPPRRLTADERLARDQVLLDILKHELPRLEDLLARMRDWYIDRMYRFYYQSFKVYDMQSFTAEAVDLLRSIGNEVGQPLTERFEAIVAEGTGKTFEFEHNHDWLRHTRPIVEAYWHAMYFVEMMVLCARTMERAESMLRSEWAAVLILYGMR